ncbi:hypothetical protein K435DRAFT_870749 [Dendrothele bispora CBS 962.96]|uniref:SLC26A/SulP transporter domain-containing protein n=1 Tax=Dendrothele bispora (strain CBS 962.96) TaxID=1314807 RepID=A0A4S8L6G1_DENBC|nr:hypothetical protein K435DRAFT_870749 [Dendrothele bispora CBS 962.96]
MQDDYHSSSFPVASTFEGGVGHNVPSGSVSSSLLSSSFNSSKPPQRVMPHSQDTIRLSTMELSGISFSDGMASTPRSFNSFGDLEVRGVRRGEGNNEGEVNDAIAAAGASAAARGGRGDSGDGAAGKLSYRSGLSLMMKPSTQVEVEEEEERQQEETEEPEPISGSPTPMPTRIPSPSHSPSAKRFRSHHHQEQTTQPSQARPTSERQTTIRWDPALDGQGSSSASPVNERTPLLISTTSTPPTLPSSSNASNLPPNGVPPSPPVPSQGSTKPLSTRLRARLSSVPSYFSTISNTVLYELPRIPKYLPAVLLGSLLNILDGVSYGMIIFPSSPPFTGLGPMGVSMFFMSCLVAQLTYSLGGKYAGSGFAGANGSMMIEVVHPPSLLSSHFNERTTMEEVGMRRWVKQ